MPDEVRVDPTTLDGKAADLQDEVLDTSSSPTAPCAFDFVVAAAQQVDAAASSLKSFTAAAEAEASRLAAVLTEAASVYRKVDERAKAALSQDPPQPVPADPEPVNPHLPPPVQPTYTAPPDGPPGGDIGTALAGGPKAAAQVLASGDPSSMASYAAATQGFSSTLTERADAFTPAGLNWEGSSAEAAGEALDRHSRWLTEHSARYTYVSDLAQTMADAYRVAKDAHPTVEECQAAEEAVIAAFQTQDPGAMNRALEDFQKLVTRSEEVLTSYSAASTGKKLLPFQPPPNGATPFGSIAGNGNPFTPGQSKPGESPASGGSAGGGGGAGSGGGGGPSQPGGAPTSPAVSPASAGTPSGGEPSGESAPGGGSPSGGGSTSGAGSPSGAGLPSLPGGGASKDLPTLPDDPGLRPAAADAGGGAGGGSGGGSGGGAGPMPLQPSVGGVAVGPGPAGGVAPGGAAPGGGTAGGGTAGGMGGMPMGGHGQGQGGGKEKRRTPGLTPDEDIYTEERPWTEAVIGNRRRKDVKDVKDSQ